MANEEMPKYPGKAREAGISNIEHPTSEGREAKHKGAETQGGGMAKSLRAK